MTRELEARQESRQQKRDANARTRSDQRGSQTLRQNQPNDARFRRARCHAHTDLIGALRN